MNSIKLNNGIEMPLLGMGTYPLNGYKLVYLTFMAARIGYRSFDTASAYGNETKLGWGLKFCGIKRKDLFVTSKLSNADQRRGNVHQALQNTLKRLKLKYLDLYLMHWPNPETWIECWKQMEELYNEGLVRTIGVCNCHQHHLETLLESATVIPAVNQFERHPFLSQQPLINFCREKGITPQAYSPLAQMHEKLRNNEALNSLATKYNKTVPQIVLKWDYQQDIITAPKSSTPQRLRDNFTITDFELTDEEMDKINTLNENFRVRHDPDNCDFSKL